MERIDPRLTDAELNVLHYRRYASLPHAEPTERQRQVASILLGLNPDPLLLRAAYLTGLTHAERMRLAALRDMPENLQVILSEYDRLSAFMQRWRAPKRDEFNAFVLPGIGDGRTLQLLVGECLVRYDPRGDLRHVAQLTRVPGGSKPWSAKASLRADASFDERDARFLHNVAAPSAEALGLWDERNALEDLAIMLGPRAPLDRTVQAADRLLASSDLKELLNQLSRLTRPHGAPATTWRLRHLASMARFAGDPGREPGSGWLAPALRMGYVHVACDHAAQCYDLLAHLHENTAGPPDSRCKFFDSIHHPTRSGYRAMHTEISLALPAPVVIKVRFVLPDERSASTTRRERRPSPQGTITVYTPKAIPHVLPAGATPLNFAAKIGHSLVAYVESALVNDHPVGPLHRLKDGDTVYIVRAGEPVLPPGFPWLDLPRRRGIRTELRAGFRPWLRERGLTELARRVAMETGRQLLDNETMRPIVALAWQRQKSTTKDLAWALEQIGLQVALEARRPIPFDLHDLKLEPPTVDALVSRIALLRRGLVRGLPHIALPQRLLKMLATVTVCPLCSPLGSSDIVATVDGDRALLHHAHRECAEGGFALEAATEWMLERARLHVTHTHVQARNEPGIAADILDAFHRRGLDVREIVARDGNDGAVIRIETLGIMPDDDLAQLTLALQSIPEVEAVYLGPTSKVPQVVRAALPPPRAGVGVQANQRTPYWSGEIVRDEQYFYGRSAELSRLHELLRTTRDASRRTGVAALVTGPLKVGKSSLVEEFLQRASRAGSRMLIARVEVIGREPWHHVERRIAAQLEREWRDFTSARTRQEGEPDVPDVFAVLGAIADVGRPPVVVIVVDECQRTFQRASSRSTRLGARARDGAKGARASRPGRSQEALLRFARFAAQRPKTMVIWICPSASIAEFTPELQHLLASAERITPSPLTAAEALELLSARKLPGLHEIKVTQSLAEEAHRLTEGNPFWLQILGRSMWSAETTDQQGVRTYSDELLENAALQFMLRSDVLGERVQLDPHSATRPWQRAIPRILEALARAGAPPGLHFDALLAAIPRFVPRAEVLRAMDFLIDSGALTLQRDNVVRFTSPLLARWVAERWKSAGGPGPTRGAS